MIANIVGRCHVSDRFSEVLRYLITCMKRGAWKTMDRKLRREIVAEIVKTHKRNQDEYYLVMMGRGR